MDPAHVAELTSKFSTDIAALKEALEPLLNESLNETASKLPLLDQAKLFTFAAYSLESILYSNLSLAGTDPKSHPIFTEIARVQQYFAKIKAAEERVAASSARTAPRLTVDKQAIGRMIRHELASNLRRDNAAAGTKRKFDEGAGGGEVAAAAAASVVAPVPAPAPAVAAAPAPAPVVTKTPAAASKAAAIVLSPEEEAALQEDFMAIDEPKKGKSKKAKKAKKSKGA